MERYNIKIVEKKWQDIWAKNKTDAAFLDKNKKNSIALKCFLTPQVKFIWVMFEIIRLEMF